MLQFKRSGRLSFLMWAIFNSPKMTRRCLVRMTKQKISRRAVNKKRRHEVSDTRRQGPLSAADWVTTAADVLVHNNVNGVDIPNLCKRLGVTKGSFYWHFGRRGDLLAAILVDWRARMTLDVSERASRVGGSAASGLGYLLGLTRKPRPNRNGAIERSVRDWARIDLFARAAVIEVDQNRLAFFEGLFRKHNFPEKQARIRAYAAYAIMMGDSILKETIETAYPQSDYVNTFVELLLNDRGSKK